MHLLSSFTSFRYMFVSLCLLLFIYIISHENDHTNDLIEDICLITKKGINGIPTSISDTFLSGMKVLYKSLHSQRKEEININHPFHYSIVKINQISHFIKKFRYTTTLFSGVVANPVLQK